MPTLQHIPHPGKRIKADVIPSALSVTKAAQVMGVGRPALSNLLNGKAALSPDMAARLEKAFKYPRKDLMKMQTEYEAALATHKKSSTAAKAYVPPFLAIKANDVEQWAAHNISARSRFAVFVRTLVHSTGSGLTRVDFPGNDDAERPGWDGFVEAGEGTPWIPAGRSGWEFGTNENPKKKADGDFEKSVRALDKNQRAETEFVFVTPRRWPGKAAWLAAKQAKGIWSNVRAYDASDLEQWLEQSLPAQVWFANETRSPAQHVRSLDKCWEDWAGDPPLAGALFSSAVEAAKRAMLSRLSRPPEGPILIAADSTEEALAFLAQLLGERGGEELASYRDRVLVFDKPGVLPRLATSAQNFIPVVSTREVERELAPYATSTHSIVIYPRNAGIAEAAVVLEPANYDGFHKALEEMGKHRDEAARLENASGRSLTVLRRQLSAVPAVRRPEWAADRQTAGLLVPFLFVGAWSSQNEADKHGLSLLADGRPYGELERECQSLAQRNDAPLWSVGALRGVISKIDLLFAIAGAVTADDLSRYFSMARRVLGEDDPALDLDEDQRWAAWMHGKTREFSSTFRKGISETLVLLAVHGGHLFKGRLGVDTESEAARVVHDLLPTPLTTRVLEANDRDLPTYAEAAPDEFLSILERDLKSDDPAVLGLLRPVDSSMFGCSPSRTGLLWALEGLSWNPATLPRAALILGRLAEVKITDNWMNKPINSLLSIFRAWMPQTAASHQERVDMMKKLTEKAPDVAWGICVAQFGSHHHLGHYSHKPRWRPDGYGFGEPFPTWGPVREFIREMVEIALTWRGHSLGMLCDLIERLYDLTDADQDRVWALIEAFAKKASDAEKARIREKIRVSTLSRRAAVLEKKSGRPTGLALAGKAVYAALEPSDILDKHVWLFRAGWVEESADEIEEIESIDFQAREERIRELRMMALRDILAQRGLAGILELSEKGQASWVIGNLAASALLSEQELGELLRLALTPILAGREDVHSHKNLIEGAVRALMEEDQRNKVLKGVAAGLSEAEMGRLFVLAPFGNSTWRLVDALGEAGRAEYWSEVTPDWLHDSDAVNNEAVERLLKTGRPRAAFSCIRFHTSKLDAEVLFRVLSAMMEGGGNDRPGHYMLDPHALERAFAHLDASPALTLDQKAGLEFAYIEALARPWDRRPNCGIPNLERYVEAHPELFVQAIVWISERKDGAIDPAGFQVPPERVKTAAERGYKLLEAIQRIPGHNDVSELETARLSEWIATVRRSCAELGRAEVADVRIGKMLFGAPVGKDDVWPCEPVRDVMEDIQSEPMMRGAHDGVYNSRGVHTRGEDGGQERELAAKYRKWGRALQVSHPFVSSRLLMGLAQTYDREASREDTEGRIRRRLH